MAHDSRPFKFKRKKLFIPKDNPVDELLELYHESEEDQPTSDNPENSFKVLVDKKRQKRRRKILITTTFLLAILAAAALGGFIFFNQRQTFTKEDLKLEILGPEKIKAGETLTYTIHYQNQQIPLQKSSLAVQYPAGFIVQNTEPATKNHSWSLGYIGPGVQGNIKITGQLTGDLTQEQKISATLNFRPENFNSDFSQTVSLLNLLEVPDSQTNFNGPANITLGTTFNIEFKVKNQEQFDLKNVKFVLVPPKTFIAQTADPKTALDNLRWTLPRIPAFSESAKIQIAGQFPKTLTFASEADRTQTFNLETYLGGPEDQYYLLKKDSFNLTIVNQALSTNLIVNGSINNKNLELGSVLTFSLVVKNQGQQTFNNAEMQVRINSQPAEVLDWQKINDPAYGRIDKTDTGEKITWTKAQVPALAQLKPGAGVTLNFTLPIKNISQLTSVNQEALSQTQILTTNLLTWEGASSPLLGNPINIGLNSNLDLNAKGLYYYEDGTPLGSGPWPPKVNAASQIKIFWDLTNSLHELENISVTTTLPEYVKWSGEKSTTVGDVSYNEALRQITWQINRWPTTLDKAGANFSIVLTPPAKEVNQILKLTGTMNLSAKDTFTNDLIIKTKNVITSILEQDNWVKSSGIVQP